MVLTGIILTTSQTLMKVGARLPEQAMVLVVVVIVVALAAVEIVAVVVYGCNSTAKFHVGGCSPVLVSPQRRHCTRRNRIPDH